MLRIAQNHLGCSGFHDLALVHDDQPLGPFGGQGQVVGDQQHRRAELAGELLEVVEHAALHGDVQRRCRLVGDQQPRPASQPDRDQGPLAHSAGQLVRILPGAVHRVGHAGVGQQFRRATVDIVRAQRFSHLETNSPDRVQVGHRILRHITDPAAPDSAELPSTSAGEIDAVEFDAARRDSATGRK